MKVNFGSIRELLYLCVAIAIASCATAPAPKPQPRQDAAGEGTSATGAQEKGVVHWNVALSKDLRKSTGFPGEYIAFSITQAEQQLRKAIAAGGYLSVNSPVLELSGINQVEGIVHYRPRAELILVGKHDPSRQPLTLEDFAVALRARFVQQEWPEVSIDPTGETERTGLQVVRFKGGVENTQFGVDLLDADYTLKQISLGLVPGGASKVKSYWDLQVEDSIQQTAGSSRKVSRFWFYPIIPLIAIRDDVASIRGLKVAVMTEPEAVKISETTIQRPKTYHDPVAERFAKLVTDNLPEIARMHRSFSRVQGLEELIGLTKALEDMDARPDLSFWLHAYPVRRVETPQQLELLTKKDRYTQQVGNIEYRGRLEISGGVQLKALALRVRAGDVTALRDAVLRSKPRPNALTWTFIAGEWLVPTSPGMLKTEDVVPLFAQAEHLRLTKSYQEAIALYSKVIELAPKWGEVFYGRALAFENTEQYDDAIADYTKTIELVPTSFAAYNNRGALYAQNGLYDRALLDFNKTLELNPSAALAYSNRGAAYAKQCDYDRAINELNKAIALAPQSGDAYRNRGITYFVKGDRGQAIADWNHALKLNPHDAKVHFVFGLMATDDGKYQEGISYFDKAIAINNEYTDAYSYRGRSYAQEGMFERAFTDFNLALALNPSNPTHYYHRGIAYLKMISYDQAIKDFDRAMELRPKFADAAAARDVARSLRGEREVSRYLSVPRTGDPLFDAVGEIGHAIGSGIGSLLGTGIRVAAAGMMEALAGAESGEVTSTHCLSQP